LPSFFSRTRISSGGCWIERDARKAARAALAYFACGGAAPARPTNARNAKLRLRILAEVRRTRLPDLYSSDDFDPKRKRGRPRKVPADGPPPAAETLHALCSLSRRTQPGGRGRRRNSSDG